MAKYNVGDKVKVKCGTGIFGRQLYTLGHILIVTHLKVMCSLGNGYGVWWVKKKYIEVLKL